MAITKQVKYPMFLQAREYTLIKYWQDVLTKCASGKFPKGMSMSKTIIYVNKKSLTIKYRVPDTPQELLKTCMEIFKQQLKIKTEKDKQEEIEEFKQHQLLRKTAIKDKDIDTLKGLQQFTRPKYLFDNFILSTGKKHNLTVKEMKKLKNAIVAGKCLKHIRYNFKDNQLVGIEKIKLSRNKKNKKINVRLVK